MIQAGNTVNLIGGICSDISRESNSILKFRLAVGYASNDKEDTTGYFDVVYFIGDSPNAKFVSSQVEQGKLRKGSQIALCGRLVHSRWVDKKDNSKRSAVQITAEAIDYVGRSSSSREDSGTETTRTELPERF